MTGTMAAVPWAAMDVHARSTYAGSLDVITGELCRQRFDTGAVEPQVLACYWTPGPVSACYEAGPTGFGLYRAAVAAGIECQVIAPTKTPRVWGSEQVRSSRYRSVVASVDGRRVDGGGGAVPDVRGGQRSREGAGAGPPRSDALRHRLSKLLLRHGRVWDRSAWTKTHRSGSVADLRASQHGAGVHRQPRRVRRADPDATRSTSGSRGSRPDRSSGPSFAGCARSAGSTPSRR